MLRFSLHIALAVLAAAALVGCEPKPPVPKVAQLPQAQSLAELRDSVGNYPYTDSNYLEQGVLAARLKALLGERYPQLLSNMRAVSALTEVGGLWFISGNSQTEDSLELAAVVIDPAQNALRVWLRNSGQAQEFVDPPAALIPWPKDVQSLQQ